MSRVIALNRIPRTNLANRPITYRGPSVAPASAGFGVGDIRILTALPVIPKQTWQDVSVALPGPILAADYPDLWRVQGPFINGAIFTVGPVISSPYAADSVCAWKGAVYGLQGPDVKKKTSQFGAYGATLWFGAASGQVNNMFTFMGPDQAASSRMFHTYVVGGNGVVRTISDDAAPPAAVSIGNDGTTPYVGWLAFDTGAPNTFIMLGQGAGPIFRTTNGGTSWTPITSTLSTGAPRVWCGIWRNKNSGALHMIGAALAIATSTDEGLTWVLNAAVPGATAGVWTTGYGGVRNFRPSVAFDWIGRRGYVLTDPGLGGGGQLSFDLDNPTAGYTVMLPTGNFSGTSSQFAYCSAGMFVWANYNQAPKTGLWFSLFGPNTVWTRFTPLTDLPAQGRPLPLINSLSGIATEAFGVLMFDNNLGSGAGIQATWATVDGFTGFDRVVLADPGLSNGRKLYIRVL